MSGDVVDVTILGAGPTGLSAAYYVGHRDGTVRIVESLEQIGGQVAATYPEKHVYDVAGFPKVLGQKLVDMCAEQGLQYGADVRLGEEAKTLERLSQNGEELLALTTDERNTYLSRAMIITAGHGAFEPRRLGIEGIDEWLGRGLHYVVKEKAQFAGKHCVIVGGGDSALDWTLGLQDTADLPITLVHRRDRFRALESSLNEARRLESEGAVRILTPHEVREVHGDGTIEAVSIENTATGETVRYDCEALITLLGFVSHLGSIAEWGLELEGKRQIKIDPMTCATSMSGVYAAGDVAGYPGKITLITVGMGEAAIAANNAIAAIRGEKVQPKYSTDERPRPSCVAPIPRPTCAAAERAEPARRRMRLRQSLVRVMALRPAGAEVRTWWRSFGSSAFPAAPGGRLPAASRIWTRVSARAAATSAGPAPRI